MKADSLNWGKKTTTDCLATEDASGWQQQWQKQRLKGIVLGNNNCFVTFRQSQVSTVSNVIIWLSGSEQTSVFNKKNKPSENNSYLIKDFCQPFAEWRFYDTWEKDRKVCFEKGWGENPHLLKHRFVVVDIVNSDDDPRGGGERVQASRCIVVRGRYVQDVLQALELGQRSGAETDQPCKDHGPIDRHVIWQSPSLHIKRNHSISHQAGCYVASHAE